MRAEERLLKLISMADGNEPSKESRAMAASLAAGIGYVENIISKVCSATAMKLFTHPDEEYIKNALGGVKFKASRGNVTVSEYDSKTIGEIISKCFYYRCNINLSGNGLSWTQIKQIGASFSQIKKLKYRWDMIESR